MKVTITLFTQVIQVYVTVEMKKMSRRKVSVTNIETSKQLISRKILKLIFTKKNWNSSFTFCWELKEKEVRMSTMRNYSGRKCSESWKKWQPIATCIKWKLQTYFWRLWLNRLSSKKDSSSRFFSLKIGIQQP